MGKQYDLLSLVHPFPRQIEFAEAVDTHKYILYGGAKGGGKSYILRWILIRQLIKWATQGFKKVRVGLFCEDYPSLKDRQITKIATEFPQWLGVLQDSQIHGMSYMLRPQFGGGVIALRNLDDPSKYASSEFAMAAVDELTKNNREVFDQLRSIIRWPHIENTKFVCGSNPGGIGHDWVKNLFITRQLTGEDPRPEEIGYIKSLPTDNPYNAKSYIEELKRLPEKLRKAYLEGNWDVFEGQYFTEWNIQQHTVSPSLIPDHWKRFRSYDHGRTAPACCLWGAIDNDGRIWIYRELYLREKNADEIAFEINRLSQGESYDYSVADPSIFARLGFVDKYGGQTIAETFARNGIVFFPASNRRIDGWNLMHQYLAWNEHKQPKLVFFNTCYNSIRTIPAALHDAYNSEDIDTRGEDHALDAIRYLLMSLHERTASPAKTDTEKKLEQMKQRTQFNMQNLNEFYYGATSF